MRLIDADALIAHIEETLCKGCDNYNGIRCRACSVDDAIGVIDDWGDNHQIEQEERT